MNIDAVAILEAAYDLEADHREWMSSLFALLAPLHAVGAAKWTQIVVHVAAAARLRRALAGGAWEDVECAEVLLDAPAPAERTASPRTARDCLRAAAKAVDRARGSAPAADDEVLGFWRGLTAGRWSLVDCFDSEGRRYLVARRNDPGVRDPRGLSLRERQVLALAASGQPLKIIAFSLGLSLGTVAQHRAQGMRKLRLRSTTELVRLFTALAMVESRAPPGLHAPLDSSPELVS